MQSYEKTHFCLQSNTDIKQRTCISFSITFEFFHAINLPFGLLHINKLNQVLYIIILNQTLEITALQNLQNWLTVRAGINHVRNNSIGPQRSIVLKISLGEIFSFSWSWWRLKWFENKSKYCNYFEKGFFFCFYYCNRWLVWNLFLKSL